MEKEMYKFILIYLPPHDALHFLKIEGLLRFTPTLSVRDNSGLQTVLMTHICPKTYIIGRRSHSLRVSEQDVVFGIRLSLH
jgi:hypothetical protein